MVPQWIIEKKRDGHALSDEEIDSFIGGFARGDIPDYQMASLAMAIYFRGMTLSEMVTLTRVMMASGEVIDTSSIPLPKVDKHSTGGIGDKVSIILAPLIACCDVAVPMISGRGLGTTGGTLDKMESIPGYRTGLTPREFLGVLGHCGCSIIGQTETLVPADRKLYALRDVTGTVPSIPLIVGSIMSKKLAEGIDGLVLDVKCGCGAFMKTRDDAMGLAKALTTVGRQMGKRTVALVTAMDEPIGRAVGNSLEVMEAIEVLKGGGSKDLLDLTLALAAEMLRIARPDADETEWTPMLDRRIKSGEAFERFKAMVLLHGGDVRAIDDPGKLPAAQLREPVVASRAGVIAKADAEAIGKASLLLGAGRTKTADTVDHGAGVADIRKVGGRVEAGDVLAVMHAGRRERLDAARSLMARAFTISDEPVGQTSLILERV